jgi:hypothetical protein
MDDMEHIVNVVAKQKFLFNSFLAFADSLVDVIIM